MAQAVCLTPFLHVYIILQNMNTVRGTHIIQSAGYPIPRHRDTWQVAKQLDGL